MALFDLPLAELQTYRPALTRQPDFEQFWRDTLAAAHQQPLAFTQTPLHLPYGNVHCFRATYHGWQHSQIVGTYAYPTGDGPFPAIAIYHGYSSSRPDPFELLGWTAQGYAVLAIDIRGQSGESSDTSGYPGGHAPGYLTQGIADPAAYYYRGVYVDAVRAVHALAARPEVDAQRIVLSGASQGGGIVLATAALATLAPDIPVRAAVAEIPFLCHFERAATLVDTEPYLEIGDYCRYHGADPGQVFQTLSYFDCLNLAPYIQAPTLITVGLMDDICPPSTIFAVYNHTQAHKEIFVAPFGDHATFPGVHAARARWFQQHLS